MYIKVLIVKIKKKAGGECRCRRLDLSQNLHKLEKKTKKEEKSGEKNVFRAELNPRPADYRSCT